MNNIAIFVNTLNSGGAEKQSIFLLNALNNKFKVHLIIFYGNQIEEKITNLIVGNNYTLIKLQGNTVIKLINVYNILRANKITHLFSYLTKPNFYGALIGRLAGIKYIYGNIRTSKLPFWKTILEITVSILLSTATIFNSYAGENIFKKKGIKKTIIISNCFSTISAPHERDQRATIKIITVGRFVEEKDYFTALNAIKELQETTENFVFYIVGYGSLEQQIREKVVNLGLTKYVKIIINPDNIPELLNNADIYLSTSLFEGTSNSIMEAMNASLPIVATKVGDNNRLVIDGKNGFLHNIGDYNSISESLAKLISNYEVRLKFGLASNQILSADYSFDKFKERYIRLLNCQ